MLWECHGFVIMWLVRIDGSKWGNMEEILMSWLVFKFQFICNVINYWFF